MMERQSGPPIWERAAGAVAGTGGHPRRSGLAVSDEARYITGVTLPVDAGFVNKR